MQSLSERMQLRCTHTRMHVLECMHICFEVHSRVYAWSSRTYACICSLDACMHEESLPRRGLIERHIIHAARGNNPYAFLQLMLLLLLEQQQEAADAKVCSLE